MTTTYSTGEYVTVGSHIPAVVAQQLADLARTNERSVSGEIRLAIKNHLTWTKTR